MPRRLLAKYIAKPQPTPPAAERRPVSITHHGVTLVDDYAWLKASNWREAMLDTSLLPDEIVHHLEAENAYAEAVMRDTKALRRKLMREMDRRVGDDGDDAGEEPLPHVIGEWAYFTRPVDGKDYDQFCRRPRDGGKAKVLVDCNREARGCDYFELSAATPSPDHTRIAYSYDATGAEAFQLAVRDITTGRRIGKPIEGTSGSFAWCADSRTLLYVALDGHHRPALVKRHRLDGSGEPDAIVYAEPDPAFDVNLTRTPDGGHILIECENHVSSETLIVDGGDPACMPRSITGRQRGLRHSVEVRGGRAVILTNDGADDFRIVEAPLSDPGRARWRELVPHVPGHHILSAATFARHVVRLERRSGLPWLVIREVSSGTELERLLADEPAAVDLEQPDEETAGTVRLTIETLTTPERVLEVALADGAERVVKAESAPQDYDRSLYVVERLEAAAADGARVPITVLRRAATPRDGTAPLILYGYGAYGVAADPSFDADRLMLLDRGFIYAIAHVRGGDDKGRAWYEAGRGRTKMNSFADFIAASRALVAHRYTAEGRIIAHGDSAGGMLVAGAANMAPELFLAVIAEVPFVDPLNTLLDADLPLTPGEWAELGNPIASAEDFRTILAYSPYENVTAQRYPHILAKAGLSDQRVTYWEPAKWVARLRERKVDDSLVLLRTSMTSGHDGASGGDDQTKDAAFDMAFILKVAGEAPRSV
ncbi:MAG: S9 family peptidase [Hyphomicrobiaceae bacterium]